MGIHKLRQRRLELAWSGVWLPDFEFHSRQTSYNDHFETPQQAFVDVLPLLQCIGIQRMRSRTKKRRRDEEDQSVEALQGLTVYDPFYCQGSMRTALGKLGLEEDRCLNANEDFYKAPPSPSCKVAPCKLHGNPRPACATLGWSHRMPVLCCS